MHHVKRINMSKCETKHWPCDACNVRGRRVNRKRKDTTMIDKIYLILDRVVPWMLGGLAIAIVVALAVGIWMGE